MRVGPDQTFAKVFEKVGARAARAKFRESWGRGGRQLVRGPARATRARKISTVLGGFGIREHIFASARAFLGGELPCQRCLFARTHVYHCGWEISPPRPM